LAEGLGAGSLIDTSGNLHFTAKLTGNRDTALIKGLWMAVNGKLNSRLHKKRILITTSLIN